MLNSTCRMLSAGCKFVAEGQQLTVRPCCLHSESQAVVTKQDVINWRQRMHRIDSYRDALCADCNYLERSHVKTSRRDLSFQFVPDTAQVGDPVWLEIQTDMTCNGGCVMCGPEFSSFWAQEMGQAISSRQRPDYVDQIAQLVDLQQTRHVVILGGEPMLSDIEERLLSKIREPNAVTLQITTNGSIYPDQKRFAVWKEFGSILLNFSIDGIGQRFEYLRYPLKWHRVEENMRRLNQQAPDNVRCKVNHTLTSLNIFYFDEFDQWYHHNFSQHSAQRGWGITVSPAKGILSPQTAGSKLAAKVQTKYKGQPLANVIEHTVEHNASLDQFLSTIDRRRNLDWRLCFAEIANDL